MAPVPPEARAELAATGKLRAAINFGNPVLAQKDAATGEPRGISVDLARELGRRLGVPVELVLFDAAGKVFEAARTATWDVAFLAIDPARATEITFTASSHADSSAAGKVMLPSRRPHRCAETTQGSIHPWL